MSVEFVANNNKCYGFGCSNGTWFELLKILKKYNISELNDVGLYNDPFYISKHGSLKIYKIMKKITMPKDLGEILGTDRNMRDTFLEFFKNSDGFRTH